MWSMAETWVHALDGAKWHLVGTRKRMTTMCGITRGAFFARRLDWAKLNPPAELQCLKCVGSYKKKVLEGALE